MLCRSKKGAIGCSLSVSGLSFLLDLLILVNLITLKNLVEIFHFIQSIISDFPVVFFQSFFYFLADLVLNMRVDGKLKAKELHCN